MKTREQRTYIYIYTYIYIHIYMSETKRQIQMSETSFLR